MVTDKTRRSAFIEQNLGLVHACAGRFRGRGIEYDALLARTPKTLVLDLGGVGFMDSSGVGLILGRQRCARSLGGTLRIQHAPEQLRRVLRLANIPCTDAGQEE